MAETNTMQGVGRADLNAVKSVIRRQRYITAARRLERVITHQDPDKKTQQKTKRLERSLRSWIQYFGKQDFYLRFSPDHHEAIDTLERCINHGEQYALAMPRGSGKTTITQWGLLYAMLTGKRRYITYIAATDKLAQAAHDFIKLRLETSDLLHEHYPHVTTYVRAAEGKPLRAANMIRADMKGIGFRWTKDEIALPDVTNEGQIDDKGAKIPREKATGYPSNGVIMRTAGIAGAVRGAKKDHAEEASTRPDFVILDDPQTRDSSQSETQTETRENIINGDVLGLAGPDIKIAAAMLCTVITPGDLSSRFLDHKLHPEWQGKTTKMVVKWPDAQDTLWSEYGDLWRQDQIAGTKKALKFYRKNRKAMDKGGVVSWPQRKLKGDISALQHAQDLLLSRGSQFYSEYQNDPQTRISSVYTLTPHLIMSRTDKERQPGEIPEWTELIIAASDINPSYALTSAVTAFGGDQRAAVLWYHIDPMSADNSLTEMQMRAAVYAQLSATGQILQHLPCKPHNWYIDAGGTPQGCVIEFSANSRQICGVQAWACFGQGFKKYRQTHRTYRITPGENLHTVTKRGQMERWVLWHADYWREISQRGWTGSPGAPGSISLPAGYHKEFAEQICREQLTLKQVDSAGGIVWNWHTASGAHDFGDVMAQTFMGAAHSGIGSSGAVVQAAATRKRYTREQLRGGK